MVTNDVVQFAQQKAINEYRVGFRDYMMAGRKRREFNDSVFYAMGFKDSQEWFPERHHKQLDLLPPS